jgi:hypothetical protein
MRDRIRHWKAPLVACSCDLAVAYSSETDFSQPKTARHKM